MLVKSKNLDGEWENMSLPVKRVWIQVGDNHLSVIESDGEIVLQTEGGMVIRPMSGNQVVINSEG